MGEVNEISAEEANEIFTPMAAQTRSLSRSVSVPILLGTEGPGSPINEGGSCGLIDSGKRTFGVTAAHVWRAVEKTGNSGKPFIQLGDFSLLDYARRLISISDNHDIATFAIDRSELPFLRVNTTWETKFFEYWSPIIPVPRTIIFMTGWPKAIRKTIDGKTKISAFSIYTQCVSVSQRQVSFVREERAENINGELPAAPIDFDPAGISGAPMFTLVSKNGFIRPSFCGVFTEQQLGWNIYCGARADYIDEDGMVHDDPIQYNDRSLITSKSQK